MPTVGKFPRSHKFTLGDRIEAVALGVLEALIDATYTKERNQQLRAANLGIEKLRFLLRLAADHHSVIPGRRHRVRPKGRPFADLMAGQGASPCATRWASPRNDVVTSGSAPCCRQ